MHCNVKALKVFTLDSLDEEIDKVKEFSFEDQHWAVRNLVADTGDWTRSGRFVICRTVK